jgi:hypothetical protein
MLLLKMLKEATLKKALEFMKEKAVNWLLYAVLTY